MKISGWTGVEECPLELLYAIALKRLKFAGKIPGNSKRRSGKTAVKFE